VQVVPDMDAENPREWGDPLWTWAATEGAGYSDKGAMTLSEIEEYKLTGREDHAGPSNAFKKEYLVFPLYLYRHSGDCVSVSDEMFRAFDSEGFDSGCMEVAYLSRKKVCKDFAWKRLTKKRVQRLFEYLKGEVAEMNAWLRGDVYGVKVTELESEKEDSVWGYYCPEREDIGEIVRENLIGWVGDKERFAIAEELLSA
jgi:hypothetical protein